MIGTTNIKVKPNKKVNYVEYIESTGTQYIDTGYCPNGNTRYELKIKNNSRNGVLFGAYNTTWETGSGLYTNVATSGQHDWLHYNSNTNTGHTSEVNNEILMDKGRLIINGGTYLTAETKTFTVNKPLYIFAGNMGGVLEQPTAYQLYYFKIYDNNVLVRDFKPCKDGVGVYCLYDKVEKRYYYNQGTGSFLGGVAAW